jgi:hypothetical protein
LGDEVAEGVLDAAVEGGVGVDHAAQLLDRDRGVDREGEQAEHLAAVGADGGGADEHAAFSVLDELDEALVAGFVDPAAGRVADLLCAGADGDSSVGGLLLAEADALRRWLEMLEPRLVGSGRSGRG